VNRIAINRKTRRRCMARSFLSVVWSKQDGAAASPDVVTLLRYPVMEAGRPVEEA